MDDSDTEESMAQVLIRRAQAGDVAAMNEAFALVRPEIERWIALRFGPRLKARLDIEDVVQETLASAYASIGKFNYAGPGAFLRWLRTIAENRIRDADAYFKAQRRDAGREEYLQDCLRASTTSPSGGLMRLEDRERLLEALTVLSASQRDIIRLVRFEGRSYADAGAELGVTAKAAGVRLVRALKALREAYDDISRPSRWGDQG